MNRRHVFHLLRYLWALKSQNSAVAYSRVQFELSGALSPRDGFCFPFCDLSQGTLLRNGPICSGCIEGPRSSCLKTLRWKALSLESDVSSWIGKHRHIINTVVSDVSHCWNYDVDFVSSHAHPTVFFCIAGKSEFIVVHFNVVCYSSQLNGGFCSSLLVFAIRQARAMGNACSSPQRLCRSRLPLWLRQLRASRLQQIADCVGQQLLNSNDDLLFVLRALGMHMHMQVKGGAAFSSHAQRTLATSLANNSRQPLEDMHMLHIHDWMCRSFRLCAAPNADSAPCRPLVVS